MQRDFRRRSRPLRSLLHTSRAVEQSTQQTDINIQKAFIFNVLGLQQIFDCLAINAHAD